MDWKKYEEQIFETFSSAYPNVKISYNQKIVGRYSKVERQIDVLIEGRLAGKKIRIVIDGKYYSKKINVKQVETFTSMVDDIEALQGILITSKGYSKAAINRAYYGPTDIELDILNFDQLKDFQGFGGITYSGWHGAILPAPFGWVIDGKKWFGSIANLYQRGKSYEEAVENGEFIYVNLYSFDDKIKNWDDLKTSQEEITLIHNPDATFDYSESIPREDNKRTIIRKIIRKETELEEYTGFVEFDDFCIFCVLFTSEQLKSKNIRKLEFIIERLMPVDIDLDSIAIGKIQEREKLIEETTSDEEKAQILISIAEIHRDMKQFDDAVKKYKESILYFSDNYGARLGLLELGFSSDQQDELVEDFYSLDPGHRKICDELVRVALEHEQIEYLDNFFKNKIALHDKEFENLGNIYFSWAELYYAIEIDKKAKEYFKIANENFKKCFDEEHIVFKSIEEVLRTLK